MRFIVGAMAGQFGGRDYISEGCELLRAQGQADIVEQVKGEKERALEKFLERLPAADAVVMSP